MLVAALLGTAQPGWASEQRPAPRMNMSCFAYRDINRNGIYDMADRPFAGLRVRLERGDGTSRARSNIGGYANFVFSAGNDEADVFEPGRYTVAVEPPAGYAVTSANGTQHYDVRVLDGSPGGLVAERGLDPVGIAPELTISGRVEADGLGIVARGSDGSVLWTASGPDGRFSVPAASGRWTIERTGDGPILRRQVTVGTYPVALGTLTRPETQASPVPVETVSFDELTVSDSILKIPNGYRGLDWSNWVAAHHKFYRGAGYVNATTSGEYVAYSGSGHPAVISAARPFVFVAANVSVAWPRAEDFDIVIRAFRGEDVVATETLRASRYGPVDLRPDWGPVTRVEFASQGYWQVVIDDMTFAWAE